jgi:hypothetical protein
MDSQGRYKNGGYKMADKSFEIFPKDSNKTYGLMELVKGTPPSTEKEPKDTIFSWPHLFYVELIAVLLVTAALLFLSLYVGAPLEEEVGRDTTPNPMKAPWYFLGLQELLVFFDPWMAGVTLPAIIIVGLMLIPFIDTNPKGSGYYTFSERKFAVSIFAFGLGLWTALIVVGVWFRGLDWSWYWPWNDWHVHKPPIVGLKDLSVIFAKKFSISEFAGNALTYIIVIAYFAGGLIIPAFIFKRFYTSLGFLRYVITMAMLIMLAGIPVKIALRLIFSIKYVMVTPWFKI